MSTRTEILERATPLARALPNAQFAEQHAAVMPAPPEVVWSVLSGLTFGDLRLTRPLMWVRTGGGRVEVAQHGLLAPPKPGATTYQEPPSVAVGAMIGRPWEPRAPAGPPMADLDELRAFDRPGWLKYGMEWSLSPLPGGRTYLETTTLCETTCALSHRRFRAYWAVIRPFSGVVRYDMLAAVRRALPRG